MMTRTLKIEERGDFFRKQTIPTIRLKGQWLAKLGFPPGSRVSITSPANGQLVITLNP